MKHKKQFYEQLVRTIKWNTIRGNTPDTLSWSLEVSMLAEEVNEVASATSEANRFKELLDIIFVAEGSLGKMGLSPEQIVEGYELVLLSNESKSSTKNAEGKITKPANFQPVEPDLQTILAKR